MNFRNILSHHQLFFWLYSWQLERNFPETHPGNLNTVLFAKCHLQHGSWQWQPLIAQVPAENRKHYPRCTVAYNWVKLQRKIIMYLITWDVGNFVLLHPHISGIFLENVHLHGLIKFLKYSQFHDWHLLPILPMCADLRFLSTGHLKNKV